MPHSFLVKATYLDASKTFAVCYAITSGTTADTTWADSYIRVTISKIQTITSIGVAHQVSNYVGHIASREATESVPTGRAGTSDTQPNLLDITYHGTLDENMKLSLVDQELGTNAKFPCSEASVAAATADSQHSGSIEAGADDKVILVTTAGLDTSSIFAVCYTEDDTLWYDSGINPDHTLSPRKCFAFSAVYVFCPYGISSYFDSCLGIRVKRSEIQTLKTDSLHNNPSARVQTTVFHSFNRIPQEASQKLEYTGELDTDKWLSIVDVSLNSNNPCVKGAIAAAAADSTHSGPMQGTQIIEGHQSLFYSYAYHQSLIHF